MTQLDSVQVGENPSPTAVQVVNGDAENTPHEPADKM